MLTCFSEEPISTFTSCPSSVGNNNATIVSFYPLSHPPFLSFYCFYLAFFCFLFSLCFVFLFLFFLLVFFFFLMHGYVAVFGASYIDSPWTSCSIKLNGTLHILNATVVSDKLVSCCIFKELDSMYF